MRSLFSGEICAAADKFKFAFERSFEILFSRVLLLGVEFSANFAAKILNSKIPPSKILSNEALLRKISYPWIYELKIPARKISFFEISQTPTFEISQALFYCASVAPRSLGALNFASQNPLVALTNVASENSCATQAVRFIKFAGSVSSFEVASSFTPTVTADRTQAASFTAANFIAIKAVKARSVVIKAVIAKVANALNLASSRVFTHLKNEGYLKEASRAH